MSKLFEVVPNPPPTCWRCVHGRRARGIVLPGMAVCEHPKGPAPDAVMLLNDFLPDEPSELIINNATGAAKVCAAYRRR